ncbi:hypothetical protein BT63DRAFT_257340 [Microthyrium microscopicum]|uniref:Uncharacterized protein n=1 Tax=Microthyrium microscopicum TaxID=703497 RepID=A0A6A6UCI8_9PEZI|nr:hypothetical protein BT63DRAFT_257340 [Microthyrium microscopicum]
MAHPFIPTMTLMKVIQTTMPTTEASNVRLELDATSVVSPKLTTGSSRTQSNTIKAPLTHCWFMTRWGTCSQRYQDFVQRLDGGAGEQLSHCENSFQSYRSWLTPAQMDMADKSHIICGGVNIVGDSDDVMIDE